MYQAVSMRWHRSLSAVGALALAGAGALASSGGAALAASATPEGAQTILQGYAAYFSQAVVDKGIVTAEPRGGDYLVTWNLQKALEAADAPKGAFHVENFSYVLTPGAGEAWNVKADHFPQVGFDVPTDKGQASGAVAFDGFHLDNAYDPEADEFLRSMIGVADMTGEFHVAEGTQISDFKFTQDELSVETRAKPSPDGAGIDVALAQAFKRLTETISAPQPDGGPPAEMTFTVGGAVSGAALAGLRAKEIGELWKYLVAHADHPGPPPELKALLQSALPLWREIRTDAKLDDLQFQMPFGTATMKSLGEAVDLSGFTASGFAEFDLRLKDFQVSSTLLPDWISSLSPASFDLSLRVTGEDWDQAARIALDDPHLGESGDLSPETGDQITQVLLAGHPKIVLTPGHLKIPALDLAFEGEASMTAGEPTAHFNVSADNLDRTIALLEDFAKVQPEAQSALLGVTLLKGLATTGADGRLVWEIESSGGAITVNGSPLPAGP
jgi:hypothetical protein